jgi:aminoglycoside phosphotransferase (APT) family kinase protein
MQSTAASRLHTPEAEPQPHLAVRILRACGWLTAAEAADSHLQVQSLERSNVVSRVTTADGRAVVVKYPANRQKASQRDVRRELYVYRLASWIPALAAVLPRAILVDEARQVLVIECLSAASEPSWPAMAVPPPIGEAEVTTRLAQAMAKWHAATADVALVPSLADGILHLPHHVEEVAATRTSTGAAFMRTLIADEECVAALDAAHSAYRPQCLIHGDIRRDNWLFAVADDTQPALKVIDWEMSGSGDPAWDVASAFGEAILQAIRDADDARVASSGWPASIEPVLARFMRAYVTAGGCVADWDRVVLFVAARLMHVAGEWSEVAGAGDGGAGLLVDEARSLLRCHATAADSLRLWAGR